MENSDLIALTSVFVAILAAIYARWAVTEMRKGNEIAVRVALQSRRLSVYRDLKEFLHFCSTYKTMQSLEMVNGTRSLVEQIESFKWGVEQHGPLDMDMVEVVIENAQKKAWQLQRLLDRLKGPVAKPIGEELETCENNIDELIDWFGEMENELKEKAKPYLKMS